MGDYTEVLHSGKQGHTIRQPPLATHRVGSRMQCADLCWRELSCQAFNLENLPGRNGKRVSCELLRTTTGSKERNESFSYWLLNRELYHKVRPRICIVCHSSDSVPYIPRHLQVAPYTATKQRLFLHVTYKDYVEKRMKGKYKGQVTCGGLVDNLDRQPCVCRAIVI